MSNIQFCDDFGHATGQTQSPITQAAWETADRLGLNPTKARQFTQGFIHAHQGRCDLLGECGVYDAGFTAGYTAQYRA